MERRIDDHRKPSSHRMQVLKVHARSVTFGLLSSKASRAVKQGILFKGDTLNNWLLLRSQTTARNLVLQSIFRLGTLTQKHSQIRKCQSQAPINQTCPFTKILTKHSVKRRSIARPIKSNLLKTANQALDLVRFASAIRGVKRSNKHSSETSIIKIASTPGDSFNRDLKSIMSVLNFTKKPYN